MKELFLLERQPDWPPALAFGADDKKVYVGRLDGTIGTYETSTGKLVSSLANGASAKIAGK